SRTRTRAPGRRAIHLVREYGPALWNRRFAHAFCTQVSFDPPPWLEFTTYEPSTSATRVSPPGRTHGPSAPVRMYGRRSTRRGSMRLRSFNHVGHVESSTS